MGTTLRGDLPDRSTRGSVAMHLAQWRYALPLRLRSLFRRADVERDLDDELQDHIERQTAVYLANGMRPDDARRAALVAFGGVERIKDESRDVRGLALIDAIVQTRRGVRSLWRARTYTLATVTTIMLAVGAGSTMLAVVNTVLLRPLPYPDSDRLVGLWHDFPGVGLARAGQSRGTYLTYQKEAGVRSRPSAPMVRR